MYYIFNQYGKHIGTSDIEPNLDDLDSRGEICLESDLLFESHQKLTLNEGRIVIAEPDKPSRQELQSQLWESIKTKRQTVTRGGVYLPSVDKWFHSDDASRTQYLAMQIMPQLPPNLMWKTMDGSFIAMTKELLNEIALSMMTQEQSDFANAERHRTAMMAVDNPLEYDYSDGWSEVYGE